MRQDNADETESQDIQTIPLPLQTVITAMMPNTTRDVNE